jgi:hypothetical protein
MPEVSTQSGVKRFPYTRVGKKKAKALKKKMKIDKKGLSY